MSGIICWICLTLVISVLQLAPLQWQNDLNTIQERNESQQNRDQWWVLLQGRHRSYRPPTPVSPGKRHYGSQDPWSSIAQEDRSWRPGKGTDLIEASDHHYHEQFMESFSWARYSKLDDDRSWSSQEWKTEATTYDRSGRPDITPWRMAWWWLFIKNDSDEQSTRSMGQNCRKDVVGIRWERVSNFQRYDSIVQRSTQKQKTW